MKFPGFALLVVTAFGLGRAQHQVYDVVIRGGILVDGTGTAAVRGDLAINGDRIAAVGQVDGDGKLTLDAAGFMVAPGFVDMHSHSELGRLTHGGHGPSFALQGITTEVYGEVVSPGPLGGKMSAALMKEEGCTGQAVCSRRHRWRHSRARMGQSAVARASASYGDLSPLARYLRAG